MEKSSEETMLIRLRFLQDKVASGHTEYKDILTVTVAAIQGKYEPSNEDKWKSRQPTNPELVRFIESLRECND